jgi:HK97 gp10 family phage protein
VITFKVDGLSQLATALQQLPSRVSKKIQREALVHAAEPMRQRMASTVAYEPGKPDIRDAMVISTARGQDANETAVAVGPNKAGFYGSFLEFGTAHMAAQPFARPAFDATWREALQRMRDDIWVSLAGRGGIRTATDDVTVESGPDSGGLL